jgi:hypothetical protein
MTGAQRAFITLAYNLYLIAHHAEPTRVAQLTSSFVERLKSERADDFIGKLFETYAAAAFLKAGFDLVYENESDGRSSHVEFVATYPKNGAKFSVEVKTRNRSSIEDGPIDEIRRLRVGDKLNKALSKRAEHTRVVMIEINVPDVSGGRLGQRRLANGSSRSDTHHREDDSSGWQRKAKRIRVGDQPLVPQ